MSYDDDEYGHVVETSEFVRPDQLNGHLVIVFPVGYHDFFPTRFTAQGKKSDALCCDIVDLDDKDPNGQPGKVYRASNFLQAQLVVGLRPFIGKKVLGRIGKGVAKGGMNPPWVITDLSADPVAVERAKAWRVANPNFSPSPFVPRQADPFALAPPPAPQVPAQPQYAQEPVSQSYQQQPVPAAPVAGSPQLTTEELSMLQRLRQERAQREAADAAARNPFQDQPPF